MPHIQGTFMHGVQKHASVSRDIYAQGAKACPESRACFSDVRMSSPELVYVFPMSEWFPITRIQGKQTLRMDKVNDVLALFGECLGPVNTDIV